MKKSSSWLLLSTRLVEQNFCVFETCERVYGDEVWAGPLCDVVPGSGATSGTRDALLGGAWRASHRDSR